MPPWHIERNVGIQKFKDDPSLSDAEIATIVAWPDADAPRGNPSDMPPPAVFPAEEEWHIGTPDLIVEIPKNHVVPADAADLWIDYIADSGLTEDRYLKAVEAKPGPGARSVVHHLLTYLAFAWVTWTYLEEEDFKKMVAERKKKSTNEF